MKRPLAALLLTGLLPLLSSCLVSYGDSTISSITRDAAAPCLQRADRVQVFYAAEPVDFRYERIGLVEAQGEQFASNEKVIDYLRYKAWQHCADAVIGVQKGFAQRTEGLLLDTKEHQTEYSAPVFSGIAVRIVRDSTFQARYPSVADTAFVTRLRVLDQREARKANNQLMASVLVPVIGCFIGIGYLMLKEQ